MRYSPVRVGLCCIFALVAGNVWGQQEPSPIKPAPAPASKIVQLGQPPINPFIYLGEPSPYMRSRASADWPCGFTWPQPIFHSSCTLEQDICAVECVVARAINLGNFGINTKKIADVLERGFSAPAGKGKVDQANNPNGGPNIQLAQFAGGDALELAQAGKDNAPNPDSKQMMDEINRIFKVQADLIRSMDIGAIYRPTILRPCPTFIPIPHGPCPYGGYPYAGYPYGGYPYGGYPYAGHPCGAYPCGGNPYGPIVCNLSGALSGVCYVDGCAMVLTGRTGLELALMVPQAHDILKLPRTQGLYIKEVYAKTPAEAAGFKKDDILIELDGKKVPNSFFEFLSQIFDHVKNDTPIPGVVLRAGQRLEINGMKITDKRVLPPLPHECPLDAVLPNLIQVVPGINSAQVSTNRVRELRAVARPGGITEFIWVDGK